MDVGLPGVRSTDLVEGKQMDRVILKTRLVYFSTAFLLVSAQATLAKSPLAEDQVPAVVSDSFVDAKNLYNFGMKYLKDKGGTRNLSKAFRLFSQSATKGYPQAGYQLGIMYRDGTGVARDHTESVKWLRRAASWGIKEAQIALDDLVSGRTTGSASKALGIKNTGPQGGYVAADQYRVAMMLIDNDENDYDKAIPFLLKSARAGHVQSQYELGIVYKEGKGTEKNTAEAKKWLNKAAGNGLVKARNALRELIAVQSGNGLTNKNRFRSSPLSNYVSAAERGDVIAQYKLGTMYIDGELIDKDVGKGLSWLRRAADLQSVEAQLKLGELLYKGVEVDRDFEESAKWFQMAATAGNATAQYLLANMYRKGIGINKDMEMAGKWYQRAADQGHAKARDNLAGL